MNELTGMLELIDQNVKADPEGGFLACRPLFEDLLVNNYHLDALNDMLSKHISKESDEDIFTSGKFLVLSSYGDIQLVLVRYTGDTPYIFTSPNEYMQANVSGSNFVLDRYSAPAQWRNSTFDGSLALERLQPPAAGGDKLIVKALDDVIDLHSFTRSPTVFVRLARAPQGDFEWAFDRKTLKASFYCTIRLAESNMCGIMDLLAQQGDERILPTLARLVDHPLHFVRWKAVQTVGRLDAATGLQLARGCLADPHPHVRTAAQATLARL